MKLNTFHLPGLCIDLTKNSSEYLIQHDAGKMVEFGLADLNFLASGNG
jgi:hypothetical protein